MKKQVVHGTKIVDGKEHEEQTTVLVKGNTERGFGFVAFLDRYGNECSMQDSSIATESCIWFGIDKIEPKILVPGKGWQPFYIPEDVLINSRMHLTQAMVKQLLPFLQHFAKTGEYLTGMKEFKKLPKGE